jgi:rod shape-determining protein MreD
MRFLFCIALALFFLILQSIAHYMGVPEWSIPQGGIVCVVFLAFYEFSLAGVVLSFLLGLLLDMSSAVLIGPWAGGYVVAYAMIAFISQRLFVESLYVAFSVVVGAALVSGLIFTLLAFEYQAPASEDLIVLLGQSLASGIVTPLVFRFLRPIWRAGSGPASVGRSGVSTVG